MKDAIIIITAVVLCVLLWAFCGWGTLTLVSLLGFSVKISWFRCILTGFCLSLVGLGIKVNLRKK